MLMFFSKIWKIGKSGKFWQEIELFAKFRETKQNEIEQNNKNIHVLNAPSPAATACLSIGDYILEYYRSII